MVEFWDGVKDILIVVMPALIGAISSKFIIKSWQDKKEEFNLNKEKFNLRKQILEKYTQSYIQSYSMLTGLLWEIFYEYDIPSEKSKENVMSQYKITFPVNEKLLRTKWEDKFYEVSKTVRAMGTDRWSFYAIVSIYFENEELLKKLGTVSQLLAKFESLLILVIQSENEARFKKNLNAVNTTHDLLNKVQTEITTELSTFPIRKPAD